MSARLLENSERRVATGASVAPGGLVVLLQGAGGGFHFSLLSILYFVSLFLYWHTVNDAVGTNLIPHGDGCDDRAEIYTPADFGTIVLSFTPDPASRPQAAESPHRQEEQPEAS